MKIYEIGTGYTEIPAKIGAATEIVAYNLFLSFSKLTGVSSEIVDITFDKKADPKKNFNLVFIPEKYKTVDDKGVIHVVRRLLYSWKLAFTLTKLVKQSNTETILHFHNQFNFFFFYILNKRMLRSRNVRTAFTVHSSSWSFAGKVPRNLLLEKYAIKKSNKVIAITKAIKENILINERSAGKVFAAKISCIHNGVNTETYKPLEGIQKKNRFINIGSVCDRKDQLGTIVLLADFLKEHNYEFVFAGKIIDGQYLKKIEDYVEANGLSAHVRFLGEIEPGASLNQAYNESKAYISTSKKEAGLSLVVLESLSAGLTVFLSRSFDVSLADFSDLPDTIRSIERETFNDDLVALSETDNKKLVDLGKTSRAFVEGHLSWDAIAQQHHQAFRT
ncbi:MAG: glycosyltransferase family 4 protein [Mucilaginibacter polytrichastri]|nr:glycosyltransferase family 4 protein [Mucilaginibacter polytrichastri]